MCALLISRSLRRRAHSSIVKPAGGSSGKSSSPSNSAAQVEASPAKLAFCSHGVTRLAAAQLLEQSEATSRGSWLQVHCVATGRGGSFDVFGQQATTPNMAEEMTSPFNTQCRAVEVHHLDDLLPLLSLAEESALQHDCQVVWSMALRHPLQRHMQLGCVSIVACKAQSAYTERELMGSVRYGAVQQCQRPRSQASQTQWACSRDAWDLTTPPLYPWDLCRSILSSQLPTGFAES